MRGILPILAGLALLGAALTGCSGQSSENAALDTASPTANLPAPAPGMKKKIPSPPSAGGPPVGGPAAPAGPGGPATKPGG